jgi:hypothetical protein
MSSNNTSSNFTGTQIVVEPYGGNVSNEIDWHHTSDELHDNSIRTETTKLLGRNLIVCLPRLARQQILLVFSCADGAAKYGEWPRLGAGERERIERERHAEYLFTFSSA